MKLHVSRYLALTMGLCVITCAVNASTYYVAKDGGDVSPFDSWANASTNIQTALDAAGDGDTVIVDDGQYVVTNAVTVTNGLTLRSRAGYTVTEINGGNTNRCMIVGHADAVVEGFTLASGSTSRGGGVWMTNGLVYNCSITGNYAQLFGGGVDLHGGIVSNCTISANSTPIDAGGCGGGACAQYDGKVVNCTISHNEASSGAGVYLFSNGVVEACTIVSNLAWDSLGGTGSGGGVECNGIGMTVRNCQIIGNHAQESAGGVYLSGHTNQLVVGCLIYDNETAWFGGGIYANLSPSSYCIQNCTIVGNRATNQFFGMGAGVCAGSGQALTLRNNIIYDNTAAFQGNNYHGVDGGPISGENNCTTPALAGSDNITGDPDFYNAASGNFRLNTGSPCINTGTNQSWMTTAYDLDGKSRILSNIVDMGAFEYGSEPGAASITLRILTPYEDQSYAEPATVYCDMRAEQWGGPGITQTLVTANGSTLDQAVYTNSEYCMISYTWTNVSAGNYEITLQAWDSTAVTTSMTANIIVTGDSTNVARAAVYRLYSYGSADSTYEHLWTTSESEKDTLDSWPSWEYEGIAWYAYTNQESGSTALYRLYAASVKQHHYTIDTTEYSVLDGNGTWVGEGVQYYVFATNSVTGVNPTYRFYHSGLYLHHFTISENEKSSITNHPEWGYVYEGVGFYVFATNETSSILARDQAAVEVISTASSACAGSAVGKKDGVSADAGCGTFEIAARVFGKGLFEADRFVSVPGDYNGDAIEDVALYDLVEGKWYACSLNGEVILNGEQWGGEGFVPVEGNYADTEETPVADLAVYHPDSGAWFIRTVDGLVILWNEPWGGARFAASPMDADGDGLSDLAVLDEASGTWYIRTVDGRIIAP